MKRVFFCMTVIAVLASAIQASAAERSLSEQVQPPTCEKFWSGSTLSEKTMFLSGYLTAVRGIAFILGDMAIKDEEKILRELWPLGEETDAVLAQVDAYCSRPQNSSKPLALAVAEIARQKGR